MIKSISRFLCVCAPLGLLSSVQAQAVNGLFTNARVANAFPSSTLVIANSNTIPGTASISDSNYQVPDGTGGQNRDDIVLSTDHGASAATLNINQGFTISTTITLTDGSNAPRKEAGIRINAPVTGDALFIINSDAGEIVAFGGGAPFHLFGNNAGGNGYTPGTPITLSERYDPPGIVNPSKGLLTYTVSYPTLGLNQSFSGLFDNLEGGPGPASFSVAAYAQTDGVANANDFINANFTNITGSLVPEPASLSLLMLGGLTAFRRRRCA